MHEKLFASSEKFSTMPIYSYEVNMLNFLLASILFYYIQTPSSDLYDRPNLDAQKISQIHFSEEIQILDHFEDWILIKTSFQKGWIPRIAAAERSCRYPSSSKITIQIIRPYAPLYSNVNDLNPVLMIPFESKLEVAALPKEEYSWIEVVLPDGQNAFINKDDVAFDTVLLSFDEMCALSREFLNLPCHAGKCPIFKYDSPHFVQMLYRQIGLNLPVDVNEQFYWTGFEDAPLDQLKQGDLVFYGNIGPENVGLYLNDGEFIHAVSSDDCHSQSIKIDKLYESYWPYLEGRRLKLMKMIPCLHQELPHGIKPSEDIKNSSNDVHNALENSCRKTFSGDQKNLMHGIDTIKILPKPPKEESECIVSYYFLNKEKMPLVISPVETDISLESFRQWIEEHKQELKTLLSKHAAVLLRGFPVKNAQAFANVVTDVLGKPIDYKGEGSRTKIAEGVYTSTEAPPNYHIHLHNELSCTDSPPGYICFYCEIAPKAGSGQTIIGSTEAVTRAFQNIPEVWNLFEGKTMKYISRHPPKGSFFNKINKTHKTWQDAFETADKKEVERICKEKGYEFKWIDDWIEVTRKVPAIRNPDDHFDFAYWYNQVHLYDLNPRLCGGWTNYILANMVYMKKTTRPYDIEFEDGSSIPRDVLYKIYDTLNDNTIKFDWKEQDVLLLDNFKALHGKAPNEGPRRILTSMVQ